MPSPEDKLKALCDSLGLDVPEAMAPVANYVPFVRSGNLVHISGQISKLGDDMVQGRLGEGLSVEEGQRAARLCALNLIAQMKAAAGSLDKVARVIKLGGFVQCAEAPTGAAIPQIINGASDVMVEVFGDAGRHARFAVSAPRLPLDVAVEIDAIIEVSE
jgi:enamine deaminase RidA (YjgF/YER057c/UK114 family)